MGMIIETSRSALGMFRRCRRQYKYAFVGGVLEGPAETVKVIKETTLGIALHTGMESLLKGADLHVAMTRAREDWNEATRGGFVGVPAEHTEAIRMEGLWMLTAWMTAWDRVRAKAFHESFKVLGVEQGGSVELAPGFFFRFRNDVVVENFLGQVFIVDFKSLARGWGGKWNWETQSFTQPMLTQGVLNREVHGTYYEGFLKGAQGDPLSGSAPKIMNSPLIYGVWNEETGEYSADFAWARKKGWRKFAVGAHEGFNTGESPYNYEAKIRYWINWLPEELVRDQFLTGPAVPVNREVGEAYFRDAVRDLTEAYETDHWPRSESEWNCSGCPFRAPCWGGEGGEAWAPTDFKPRKDHHKPESEEE